MKSLKPKYRSAAIFEELQTRTCTEADFLINEEDDSGLTEYGFFEFDRASAILKNQYDSFKCIDEFYYVKGNSATKYLENLVIVFELCDPKDETSTCKSED